MTLISNPTPEINVRSEYITDGRILDLSAASKRRTEKARKREREREKRQIYVVAGGEYVFTVIEYRTSRIKWALIDNCLDRE